MKKILLLGFILLSLSSFGQDFYKNFQDAFKAQDTLKQEEILENWKKTNSNNPELYTSYYNFYFSKGKKEVLSIQADANANSSFALQDSLGNTAGYMGSNTYYDKKILQSAFLYIDKGIAKFPNRLDMRFGKIYGLRVTENYKEFTAEIIKVIDFSSKNKNKWTWTLDKPVDSPKEFMLDNVQAYIGQLYNTGDDSLLSDMKSISESVLKYYPDHVESLSNVSIVYLIEKNFDKSLEYSLKANKINPTDAIVIGNIAHTYKEKGDKANAAKYYKQALQYGDEAMKNLATKELEKLK